MKACLLFLAAAVAVSTAHADVSLPAVFSDDIVLQRGAKVPVWGWAAPGEEVSVSFAGQTQKTKADDKGDWKVQLDSMFEHADPSDLVVAGKNTLTVKNVLVGEVWLCSGQSNMQMTVNEAADAPKEIAQASHPQIRMFNVENIRATEPQKDTKGRWLVCDPANTPRFSAAAYYFGRKLHEELKVPVGLINTCWGGTRAEAWTSREALEQLPSARALLADWEKRLKSFDPAKDKEDPNKTPHYPAVLFNQMIAPLVPYAIRGAIWYQGESNQKRAQQYQELLPTMINDWRTRWGTDFPFYLVQLAGFGNGHAPATEAGVPDTWAELQEAQMLTAITLPHCGVAVANDIGDEKNIHPTNKQEVGRRLALWALAKDYARQDVECSGPIFKGSKTDGKKVRIQFSHAKGLKARDGGELKGFQICGADQKWQWAKAKVEGGEVVAWSEQVAKPAGVRYAWASWSPQANLVNAAGLPASCFRTDEFPLSTLGVVSPFEENAKK